MIGMVSKQRLVLSARLAGRRPHDEAQPFRQGGGMAGCMVTVVPRRLIILRRSDGAIKPALEPAAFGHGEFTQKGRGVEMVLTTTLVACFVAQGRSEIDGYQRRQIFEAAKAAELWAQDEANRLFPDIAIVQSTGARRHYLEAEQANSRQDLTFAAYAAVCDEYHVSRKTFRAILDRPDIARSFPHTPEKKIQIQFGENIPYWLRKGTLFNPDKVRLPAKLAKRYGYQNPAAPAAAAKTKPNSLRGQLLADRPEDFVGPPSPSGR
jgi:hypothetical protein